MYVQYVHTQGSLLLSFAGLLARPSLLWCSTPLSLSPFAGASLDWDMELGARIVDAQRTSQGSGGTDSHSTRFVQCFQPIPLATSQASMYLTLAVAPFPFSPRCSVPAPPAFRLPPVRPSLVQSGPVWCSKTNTLQSGPSQGAPFHAFLSILSGRIHSASILRPFSVCSAVRPLLATEYCCTWLLMPDARPVHVYIWSEAAAPVSPIPPILLVSSFQFPASKLPVSKHHPTFSPPPVCSLFHSFLCAVAH